VQIEIVAARRAKRTGEVDATVECEQEVEAQRCLMDHESINSRGMALSAVPTLILVSRSTLRTRRAMKAATDVV